MTLLIINIAFWINDSQGNLHLQNNNAESQSDINKSESLKPCPILSPDLIALDDIEPQLWNESHKYVKRNLAGKIVAVCGVNGWEDVVKI